MIVALLFLSLICWGYWLMFRDARKPRSTPLTAAAGGATGETTALGLEDDPDRWRATRGAWTALDECQLTRLLTASAPVNRPAPNSTDNAIPHVEHEDTA